MSQEASPCLHHALNIMTLIQMHSLSNFEIKVHCKEDQKTGN